MAPSLGSSSASQSEGGSNASQKMITIHRNLMIAARMRTTREGPSMMMNPITERGFVNREIEDKSALPCGVR
jgi:hypothetical protein